MNKYIAHVTISVPLEVQDALTAYLTAYNMVVMDLNIIKSPFLVENIEIKEGK
tara:strand:+ start:965 stop:1123 length:159 start_codon:yes stop_codon:yes gene_type:complete